MLKPKKAVGEGIEQPPGASMSSQAVHLGVCHVELTEEDRKVGIALTTGTFVFGYTARPPLQRLVMVLLFNPSHSLVMPSAVYVPKRPPEPSEYLGATPQSLLLAKLPAQEARCAKGR